ncbi:MAG: hypothetical protein KAJ29_05835 [Alphaproteobacteria bacterium]|nr:hypothetical protein [Alphaproteobacteria bacterium]
MYKRFFIFVSLAFTFGAFISSHACAQSVSLDPKRIVFDGRDRSAEIYLMNSSDKEVTYRIFFQEMEMSENGSIKKIEEDQVPEGFPAASKMIRYSPRQVDIPAHSSQIVMFMARKPKDLADGEYRSHVVFQAVPDDAGQSLDDMVLKGGEVGVKIIPIFGISIPVIIRHGELSATVGISDLKLGKKDDKQVLSMTLKRDGNRSIYGHMEALYTPADGGKEISIGRIKGISVYDGVSKRDVTLTLNPPEGVALRKGGTIKLKFEEDRDMGGDATTESVITIK